MEIPNLDNYRLSSLHLFYISSNSFCDKEPSLFSNIERNSLFYRFQLSFWNTDYNLFVESKKSYIIMEFLSSLSVQNPLAMHPCIVKSNETKGDIQFYDKQTNRFFVSCGDDYSWISPSDLTIEGDWHSIPGLLCK